ncbi:MAG: sirohydrochlorin cobaltochelatase [Lachnospiraceae bacterium]
MVPVIMTPEKTIDQIENGGWDSFPDYRVYRAWTSDMIRKKLKNRDQVQIDSVRRSFCPYEAGRHTAGDCTADPM